MIRCHNNGYAALIVVIVLSAALSAATLMPTLESYYLTHDFWIMSEKKQSYYTARSCTWHALLRTIEDESYQGNNMLIYPEYVCVVGAIIKTPSKISIEASSAGEIATHLQVTFSLPDHSPISIQEIFN